LPFENYDSNSSQSDNDIANFKTCFEQLNSVSNLNLDNGLYDEIDEVTRINCKY